MSLAHSTACPSQATTATQRERDLIERAKRDPDAFGMLYQLYSPLVTNYVYRRVGERHAEDLTADVFVIVLRSLPAYRDRGVPLRFWILRIATHAVNRWVRRQRCRGMKPLDVEPQDRSTARENGQVDAERLQQALLSLSSKHQAVLSLFHLEGLSVKETAVVLGCREGTVRSRLTRARDALRKTLNGRR